MQLANGQLVFDEVNGGNDANTKLLIHSDAVQGNTTFTDSSASNHSVAANGNIQHIAKRLFIDQKSTILLDGTGDYLSIADHADFDFSTGDFTLDCWINMYNKPSADHNVQWLFGRGNISTTNGCWCVGFGMESGWVGGGAGVLQFNIAIRAGGSVTDYLLANSVRLIDEYKWHHIAFVRSSGTLYFFIGGMLIDSIACTDDLDNDNTLYIGRAGHAGTQHFNGSMSEIRISNVARWTADFEPVGLYEGVTPYIVDSSGNRKLLLKI